MRKSGLIVLATLAPLSSPASAETVNGSYAGIGLGIFLQNRLTIDSIEAPFGVQPGGFIKSRAGLTGSASVGWGFGNGLRVELEGAYQGNRVDRATAGALKDAPAKGRTRQLFLFVNGYYDFELSSRGVDWVTPYVGAGIGGAWTRWSDVDTFNRAEYVSHSDSDSSAAYQFIAGAAFPLRFVNNLSLTTEYRFRGVFSDASYSGRVLRSRVGSFPIVTNTGRSTDHIFMVGLRYAFN